MQWSTISRFPALSALVASGLVACAQSAAPSAPESAVDVAYAALVSEIASCAKELKACVDAAADDATVDVCREDFRGCREAAGKKQVDALANAARGCSETHQACVRSAQKAEAGSCQEELRVCLRAARPEQADDDDAGAGNDARKAARADCLDELHPCVKADGPANVCAEQVRACLVDSVPSAAAVVPEKKAEPGMGKGPKGDAGVERGKSGAAKDADAGVHDNGMMSAARMCVDTLRACLDAGNPARSCAQSLKECR